MKKILFFFFTLALILAANISYSQQDNSSKEAALNSVRELQQSDPQAAQAVLDALQRGDVQGAKVLFESAKKTPEAQSRPLPTPPAAAPEPPQPSLFEQKIAGNLKQFGYDLFNRAAASFGGPSTIPVGPDYIIGPGDEFTLTLWGATEGIYTLKVTREGEITLPKVGVVPVAGVRFGQLEKTLKRHLSKHYSDFNLSVAMGGLKTVTIYIVGEVLNPGSYELSSLTTVYGALFAAGGPTKQGTLRSIQVLRSGKVIKTLDLYDFLLKGDRGQDIKLQNEDTVFVPLIGAVAGAAGAVYRPAIYELKGQETLSDLIGTAGGIMPIALGGRLQLVRYADNVKKVILDIRLDSAQQKKEFTEKVRNMDSVVISPVYEKVWETVDLEGAVEHPGSFQWRTDLKVRELVLQGGLLPTADRRRADVIRQTGDMIERKIIPVDLAALTAGDEAQNVLLEPKDKIRVYDASENPANVWETVTLSGVVRNQGKYQWKPGLRVRDVIIQGQLLPESDPGRADLIRLSKDLMNRTITPINLAALMAGDETQNLLLEPQDLIRVYSTYKAAEKAVVSGEVVRAGEYEINKGERLSDLMRRVGGFTEEAYPYGVVFKRKGVKSAEERSMRELVVKMQANIAQNMADKTATAVSPEEVQLARSEQSLNQGLLESLKAMQQLSEGRVAISITANIDEWAGSKYDLLLQDGDSLVVPKRPQEILILGEVHSPGAQIHLSGMTVRDYLARTGGVTKNADEGQMYVVQADGFAYGSDSPAVGDIEKTKLRAGDSIIVPQKVERHAVMRNTKDIVDILFKTAVVVATITILF